MVRKVNIFIILKSKKTQKYSLKVSNFRRNRLLSGFSIREAFLSNREKPEGVRADGLHGRGYSPKDFVWMLPQCLAYSKYLLPNKVLIGLPQWLTG